MIFLRLTKVIYWVILLFSLILFFPILVVVAVIEFWSKYAECLIIHSVISFDIVVTRAFCLLLTAVSFPRIPYSDPRWPLSSFREHLENMRRNDVCPRTVDEMDCNSTAVRCNFGNDV
jgi:hypothetical protein